MTDILTKLDETMLGLFPSDGIQFKGICDLVTKGDQVHPVTIEDKKQVSLNDKWECLIYHRILSANLAPSDEQSFGRRTGKKLTQQVRTIVAVKAKKGENWVDIYTQSIPETLSVDLYEFINIEEIALIKDQLAVHNAEFGDTSYEKHIQTWNISALEYDIEYLKC